MKKKSNPIITNLCHFQKQIPWQWMLYLMLDSTATTVHFCQLLLW